MSDFNLSKDALFHNRTEGMSLEQLCRFDIMLLINHIVNCAMSKYRERATGNCLPMQFTVFLTEIRKAFEATMQQKKECGQFVVFDDFVRIAHFSYSAITEIIENPSTKISKVDKKVLANKTTGFGTKTMRWMAQRPGRTIEEKISPENKVLTSKTVFSVDTNENREFMYLYKILHEAISERTKGTKCQTCNKYLSCAYYEWIKEMKRILSSSIKIRRSELADVRPIKQSFQNNKLMCDKNYKIIWDAVKMLSNVEDRIEEEYNSNLPERMAMIIFWSILGDAINSSNIKIVDYAGTLHDQNDGLWFGDKYYCGSNNVELIVIDDDGAISDLFCLTIEGTQICLRNNNNVLEYVDVNDLFDFVSNCVSEENINY